MCSLFYMSLCVAYHFNLFTPSHSPSRTLTIHTTHMNKQQIKIRIGKHISRAEEHPTIKEELQNHVNKLLEDLDKWSAKAISWIGEMADWDDLE